MGTNIWSYLFPAFLAQDWIRMVLLALLSLLNAFAALDWNEQAA
jgi:hypothetical protein